MVRCPELARREKECTTGLSPVTGATTTNHHPHSIRKTPSSSRLPAVFQAAGQELGQVSAADVGELVELGAAREPVGQHHAVPGVAHRGQQGGLGDGP